jgi:hypothetical protein
VCDDVGTFTTTLKVPADFHGELIVRVASATATAAKFTVAQPAPPDPEPSGTGTRIVLWINAWKDIVQDGTTIVEMTDADLDRWAANGIGGFVLNTGFLETMGGRGVPAITKVLAGFPQRAAARGMDCWLGFRFANYNNAVTPLVDWFDDTAWVTALAAIERTARAAKDLGCVGIGIDEELYRGGSWSWNYKAGMAETTVRTIVQARGTAMMQAILRGFPNVDIIDYGTYFPGGWNEYVQEVVNHHPNNYVPFVQLDLWRGMTSVPGFAAVRFMDATFYKTWHTGPDWATALKYNREQSHALFARTFAAAALPKIFCSPFAWIDEDVANEGPFTAVRPVPYVADQLATFARWCEGDTFAIYAYRRLHGFDYGPFLPGILAASKL